MYKINDHFPVVRCLCGREMILIRARVCECGATMRFRRTPKMRGLHYQPVAVAPGDYDLANRPVKMPFVVEWWPA